MSAVAVTQNVYGIESTVGSGVYKDGQFSVCGRLHYNVRLQKSSSTKTTLRQAEEVHQHQSNPTIEYQSSLVLDYVIVLINWTVSVLNWPLLLPATSTTSCNQLVALACNCEQLIVPPENNPILVSSIRDCFATLDCNCKQLIVRPPRLDHWSELTKQLTNQVNFTLRPAARASQRSKGYAHQFNVQSRSIC